MNQEAAYPGRVIATDWCNPDFAALARAYGLQCEVLARTAEFEATFERAWNAKTAALIELKVDPDAIGRMRPCPPSAPR